MTRDELAFFLRHIHLRIMAWGLLLILSSMVSYDQVF